MNDYTHSISNGIAGVFVTETKLEQELADKRRLELRNAQALALDAEAYRAMPADLRESAERWGVPSLMAMVWLNAFQCGYLQRGRDEMARLHQDETE
ncbi:MAG: hypothetical protein DI528_22215 [Shinella sp.]|nr:MAG: hypothetical protein DI528_22215 [Shinella sp.]